MYTSKIQTSITSSPIPDSKNYWIATIRKRIYQPLKSKTYVGIKQNLPDKPCGLPGRFHDVPPCFILPVRRDNKDKPRVEAGSGCVDATCRKAR